MCSRSLRAHTLFTRDVDYIVREDKVVIIDEFTGRMMEGRRYSDGLHQALEAKEDVTVQAGEPDARLDHLPELLPPVSEARRHDRHGDDRGRRVRRNLQARRGGDPDQRAVVRNDEDDEVYRTARGEIRGGGDADRGGPRAPGSRCWSAPPRSRRASCISELLKKKQIPHAVLNARFHEQEAEIVAQAGAPGAVTIATNMAGRGTDIKLGGNLEMRLKKELAGIDDPVHAGDARGARSATRWRAAHEKVKAGRRAVRDRHRAA